LSVSIKKSLNATHQETYPFNPLFGVVSPAVGDTPHKKGVTQAPLQGTFNIPNSQKVAREKNNTSKLQPAGCGGRNHENKQSSRGICHYCYFNNNAHYMIK
jgi:hypothetical protein